ncbi:ABC transporter permease [Methyloversatilis sp.]|uniref:ABC transporter permease n=1 Tax=Methyloversatilis sp. TaxID=2569862 RepID=UPI0027345971|nr:ABC transporter permease [Methyloversatilis sp.]MDP2870908.1 ABC transporter permease [Methyloversatilis sp.]MDP3287354.1 ABC transporter permease [Methyloversatilis sp.]MDP3454132.1 ABC transporter permease [Methyloversatilis sp.]MDP3578298.1 ABC transporter permease [Methyloversatilis sp.]
MDFKPLLLWSDILLWAMVAGCVALAFYCRRQDYLRRAWRRVGESGVAMSSATILAAFVSVGLLDSLHYQPRLPAQEGSTEAQYAPEVLSALDALVADLRLNKEKTYSAPLATHAFAKETMERDGVQTRDYPRLKWGGAHLEDVAGRDSDLARRAASGAFYGLLLWAAVVGVAVGLMALARGAPYGATCRTVWQPGTAATRPIAWRAVFATLAVLSVIGGITAAWAAGYHVFGTDKVGQDVLYLSLKSVRTALLIGTLTTLVTLPLAVALGLIAGFRGGWWDDAIQYLYTVLNSIPGVLLIAAMVLMMQVVIDTHPEWFETAAERADARLLALCFILGLTSWTGLCRLLRAETLKLRELDYVQAARAFGVGDARIMARHILPNLMHIVLIALVMDFSGLVLSEAVLSYIGIGVDSSMNSFGTMINAARLELSREPVVWWSLAAAFVLMLALVLAANLFADAVRDAFDPRFQWRARRVVKKVAA